MRRGQQLRTQGASNCVLTVLELLRVKTSEVRDPLDLVVAQVPDDIMDQIFFRI